MKLLLASERFGERTIEALERGEKVAVRIFGGGLMERDVGVGDWKE